MAFNSIATNLLRVLKNVKKKGLNKVNYTLNSEILAPFGNAQEEFKLVLRKNVSMPSLLSLEEQGVI